MALRFNNTDIATSYAVRYNNTALKSVKFGSTEVWKNQQIYYNYGWSGASSAHLSSGDGLISFATAPTRQSDGSLYYELVGTNAKEPTAVVYLNPALPLSGFKTLHYNLYIGNTNYYGQENYVCCGLGPSVGSFTKQTANAAFSGDSYDWRWLTLNGSLDISGLSGNHSFQIFHRMYTWGGQTMRHAVYLRFAYCS